MQFIHDLLVRKRCRQPEHRKINESLVQRRQFWRITDNADLFDSHSHAGILMGKSFHDRREDRGRDRVVAPEPYLTDRRVGQELDVPDALLEFIEHRVAALQQRAAIHRGLDALRPAVEKPHTERVLKIADGLRHRRLGHVELLSRLGHAAPLHDRDEDVQIAHSEAPADPTFPIDRGSWHE